MGPERMPFSCRHMCAPQRDMRTIKKDFREYINKLHPTKL